MNSDPSTRLLSRDDVEEKYGPCLTRRWLELAAHKGEGPPMVKRARRVFYRQSEIEAWLAANTVQNGRAA
ncbi:MAG: AlpA family transcriptional regulator [Hyphomonadaceae bacterium]